MISNPHYTCRSDVSKIYARCVKNDDQPVKLVNLGEDWSGDIVLEFGSPRAAIFVTLPFRILHRNHPHLLAALS